MNASILQSIRLEVYRRFPEVNGAAPTVQGLSAQGELSGGPAYLVTFHSRANLPGNRTLPRWVRVTVNAQGQILKVSTSR